QAEALAHLDAADGFADQAAFVEDGAEQVLRGDTITSTQSGTATGTAFGQWHRSTTLTAAIAIRTLWTITALATLTWATAIWHQRLVTLNFSQSQRLAVGGLA